MRNVFCILRWQRNIQDKKIKGKKKDKQLKATRPYEERNLRGSKGFCR